MYVVLVQIAIHGNERRCMVAYSNGLFTLVIFAGF